MNPERWQRIKSVYGEAMEREGPEREAFLAEACGADRDLRAQVETLLLERDAPVLQSPLQERNWVGRVLGRFRVLEKIGQGGMGVIYKAEDTQLQRTVALKFLSAEVSGSEDLKARLIREAQAAAALDHPNICAVHDIHEEQGETFIAMAYIDGLSLAQKIKERPLPLDEALGIAIQIGEGLQAAHEKGIVHRDIKPHNVMLTAKGQVKVMDFGLASIVGRSQLTKSGTTLGTPSYMAPEQLEGREADRRADLWGLGCVLYEMLAQRTPFEAEYRQAIDYGILNEQAEPVTAQRRGLPTEIDDILAKALAKDPAERYQHADDLLVDLRRLKNRKGSEKTAAAKAPGPSPAPSPLPLTTRRTALIGGAALGAAAMAAIQGSLRPQSSPGLRGVRRFHVRPRDPVLPPGAFPVKRASISPDGRRLAWIGRSSQLWVQNLAEDDEPHPVAQFREESGCGPVWSPEGESILFASSGRLFRVSARGGRPVLLCESLLIRNATVSPDGTSVLFAAGRTTESVSLFRVPRGGGIPELALSQGERRSLLEQHFDGQTALGTFPTFLPAQAGGGVVVFGAGVPDSPAQRLIVMDLSSRRMRSLFAGNDPVYSNGHLLFTRGRNPVDLWAVAFSLRSLEPEGDPILVRRDAWSASAAEDGTLAYVDWRAESNRLVWRDRDGVKLETLGPGKFPRLSPDGSRVAYSLDGDILVHDLGQEAGTGVTREQAGDSNPVWSPNGRRLAFASPRSGHIEIWASDLDHIGEAPVRLQASAEQHIPTDWFAGGLIYQAQGEAESWHLGMQSNGDSGELGSPRDFSRTGHSQAVAVVHPEGRYVAYQAYISNDPQIYVERFPEGGRKKVVSANRGIQPRWSADGKELFYVGRYHEGEKDPGLYAVSVSTDPDLTLGRPKRLFSVADQTFYDVARDGQRFLISEPPAEQPELGIRIVQNWYEEFRDR